MKTGSYSLSSDIPQLGSALAELYPFLLSEVRRWVYSYNVLSWCEQQEDVVEDIVQEAVVRTLNYIRKAEYRKTVLKSLAHVSTTFARNYYLDLRRRDSQLVHAHFCSSPSAGKYIPSLDRLDPLEGAVENVFQEELFTRVAQIIASFPDKLRIALLIDLANRASADREPPPLQVALSTVGIHLQDYQRSLPENPVEQSRHISLVSLAYKRLANLSASLRALDESIEANKSWGVTIPLDEPDAVAIRTNSDLAALSERLRRTAPAIIVDPAFREELRSRLLDMVLEHQPAEAVETEAKGPAEAQPAKTLDDASGLTRDRATIISLQEPDATAIRDNPGLAALSTHLYRTTPTTTADPAFREELRSRFLDMVLEHRPAEAVETEAKGPAEAQPAKTLDDIPESVGSRATIVSFDEPDAAAIQSEPDLAVLSEHLRMTVSLPIADPAFREELRSRLMDMVLERRPTEAAEIALQEAFESKFEQAFDASHLIGLVEEIAGFPQRELTALLNDLANRMQPDPKMPLLQHAFSKVGIDLQKHQQPLPTDPIECTEYASHLGLAYQRLAELLERNRGQVRLAGTT